MSDVYIGRTILVPFASAPACTYSPALVAAAPRETATS